MKQILVIAVFLVVMIPGNCFGETDGSMSGADASTESVFPSTQFYGLGYGPFLGIQNPACGPYPSVSEMEIDIAQISKRSKRIRIYSVMPPFDQIGRICKKYELDLLPGCWIGKESFAREREVEALIKYGKSNKPKRLLVGNEVMVRGDIPIEELIGIIKRVRRETGCEVGTADLWVKWQEHPELAKACDFILVHAYGFWDNQTIDDAAAYVVRRYKEIKAAYPDKEVILGETGWPTDGPAVGNAVPGLANQRKFMSDFVLLAQKNNIPYYFFEAFNEDWKMTQESGVFGWGIMNPVRKASFKPQIISKFPFAVYDEPEVTSHFVPSGWMGDVKSIKIDVNWSDRPHSGKACTKITFNPDGRDCWTAVYWQYPENNWGELPGYRFQGVHRVTFWARGETGGETCEFKVGGIDSGNDYKDSLDDRTTGQIELTKLWLQYKIIIPKRNLDSVISGFCWATNATSNPNGCTIFLDDVRFE